METAKIERGIANYIDEVIVPNIREGMVIGSGKLAVEIPASVKKALVGTAGAIMAKKASELAAQFIGEDEDGGVNIEKLKDSFIARLGDQPIPIKIGDILEMSLTRSDINELYRYIMNA